MNVVLIGYRACGKSTVGKMLADRLKIAFLDTDLLIEEKLGMPIKEIVAGHGWEYFRAKEKEAVQKLVQRNDCVIATGGGVVLDEENVGLLKKIGCVIWLKAPVADIIERLKQDVKTDNLRPQFTDGNLAEETTMVLEKRIPLYQKAADYALDTAGKTASQVVDEICACLLQCDGVQATGV
ncbi:MAG: shikimate kinase AroL [Smithellaceae bacterium]